MLRTLLVSVAVFTVLYVGLVTLRYASGTGRGCRRRRRCRLRRRNAGYMVAAYLVAPVILWAILRCGGG